MCTVFKKAISISKTSGGNLEIVSTYVESRPNFAVLQSFHEKSLQNTRQLQNNYLRIGRIYQRSRTLTTTGRPISMIAKIYLLTLATRYLY